MLGVYSSQKWPFGNSPAHPPAANVSKYDPVGQHDQHDRGAHATADTSALVASLVQTPELYDSRATSEQRAIAEKAQKTSPLTFELNKGQSASAVKFQSRGNGFSLYLGEGAAFLSLKSHSANRSAVDPNSKLSGINDNGTSTFLKLQFCNANLNAKIHGVDEVITKTNYFKGAQEKWVTNVPNYSKVCYDEIYPGIDMVYYGSQSGMEYDYLVKPGADPAAIAMEIDNAKQLVLNDAGELVIKVEGGEVRKGRPIVYQLIDGKRHYIDGSYVLQSSNRLSFKLGAYDPAQILVIDPSIVWSTYVGDNSAAAASNNFGQDKGFGIAVDASGNTYVTGSTDSYDFPNDSLANGTLNSFVTPSNSGSITDAFISSFSADGTSKIFSDFFGGGKSDGGMAVCVDSVGAIYFTGYSFSGDFPVVNPRFTKSGGGVNEDAFVVKLAAGGRSVIFSTYIGGSGDDIGLGIASDSNGNAYVAGMTQSFDFPVKNALIALSNPIVSAPSTTTQGFIAKFSPTGSNVVFSTYINGAGPGPFTSCNSLAVDNFGNIYVGGATDGLNPGLIKNAFQSNSKGTGSNTNGFILKVDTNAAVPIFGTYLGDVGPDSINGIGVDSNSRVFVTGSTSSPNFPTLGANQGTLGGAKNAFFTIFSNTGGALAYSTFLGGSGTDIANGIAVDPDGYAYITGSTTSTNFPVNLAQQPPIQSANAGLEDVFIAKYNPTGGEIYATYLGSSGDDVGHGIAAGVKGSAFEGDAYITGEVDGRNGTFGTLHSFQRFPGATNPGFFQQITVTGTTNTNSTDIVGVSPDTSGLGVNWSLVASSGGFLAGQSIVSFPAPATNTIRMNGSCSAGAASSNFTFQSPVLTPAPDVFVTHIGDLSPRITSANTIIAAVGVPIPAYTITATNSPTSFGAAGLASPGLSVGGPNNNIITGTPNAAGVYQVLLTASNPAGTGTLYLNVIVNGAAPVITSVSVATVGQDLGFSYNITATQNPTSFNATNLPPGITVDQLTGNISGSPTAAGSFTGTISATNNIGTGTSSLTINVTPQPPVIVGSLAANGTINAPFSYVIDALNNPTVFTAAPLPPGLTLNASTGQISGTPTAVGVTNAVLSASNAGGLSVITPTLIITIDNRPAINSPLIASGTVNVPFTYTITALNGPLSFTAVGLPPGLTVTGATISGTPTLAGLFNVTLGATNAAGTSQAILSLSISPGPPMITSSPAVTLPQNSPITYNIAATNAPTSYTASGLPAGLSIDTTLGVISGSISAIGVYPVTLTATNSSGTSPQFTLTITITASPPFISSPLTAFGSVGTGFTYTITASGSAPLTFTATPLPPGLVFSGNMITGTPTVEGTYGVTLTATNSLGTNAQTLIISISNIVTTITEVDTDGDGFPDQLEIGVGTNPMSFTSTPFGGQPAGAKHVVNIQTMNIKLDFSSPSSTKDSITMHGSIPVPSTFKGKASDVIVFVGGIVRQFGVPLNGLNGPGPKDRFKLKVTNKQDPTMQPFELLKAPVKAVSPNALVATFSLTLGGANFKAFLSDEKLDNSAQNGVSPTARTVDVIVLIPDFKGFYQSAKVLQYTLKGKTGTAVVGR